MKIIHPARLRWTDDQQPFAEDFGDCYFSSRDGLAETRHVFLAGNRLTERWSNLSNDSFYIGETGLGSGLNFIASAKLWYETTTTQHLYFASAELHPLRKNDLIKAAALWPELKDLYDQLIEQYPVLTPGFHLLQFERISLLLLLGDATAVFNDLLETDHPDFCAGYGRKMDAWFLDGFAPAKNPQLWTEQLINSIALLSKPQTTLATFSAAGQMRRTLAAAGFAVQKQPGFGSKREMVTAIFQQHTAQTSMRDKPAFVSSPFQAPWYINGKHLNERYINEGNTNDAANKAVSIIGAGIAGCTAAHALAHKGFKVTVFDTQPGPAREASGNRQAILYGKFSSTDDEFAQFNLATFLYALRFYKQLLNQNPQLAIHLCGVLQLAWSATERESQDSLRSFFVHHPDLAQMLTREQASTVAGLPLESGGIFFAEAGWIHPSNICEHLLQHSNIKTVFNQHISSLHHDNNTWHLLDKTQNVHSSQHVVIANAHLCHEFTQTQYLALKHIRGQVSHAIPTNDSRQLKTVLCGDGYIAPAHGELQSFGATYTPKLKHFDVTDSDHEKNLQQLAQSSQLLGEQWRIDDGISGGRTHTRTAAPDYFPVCGPLPLVERFIERYALLRKNSHANIPEAGNYHPNLFLFAGLGSRGMTYAPLCAEVLSQQIAGGPLVLPRSVSQQLNPARFIIRDLVKNRI